MDLERISNRHRTDVERIIRCFTKNGYFFVTHTVAALVEAGENTGYLSDVKSAFDKKRK